MHFGRGFSQIDTDERARTFAAPKGAKVHALSPVPST
jgi:hypothetical protein